MKKFLLIVAFIVAVPVIVVLSLIDSAELKYKLTYEVQTPTGLRSASSIVFVRREDTTRLPLPSTGVGHSVQGEAVVIDLEDEKYLFSLIEENAYALPQNTFSSFLKDGMGNVELTRVLSKAKPSAPLSPEYYPLLVTFDDINDPTSVKEVDPANIAATFGPGFSLQSITLEITDDPVTEGEVENFGFMQKLKTQATLSGLEKYDPNKDSEIHYLTSKAFVRGDNK
ncbi:MAG: hypothetical protein ABJO57_04715 [Lentilitoribacter sp.]